MSKKFLSAVTFDDGLAQSVTFSNINGDDLPAIAFSSLSDVDVSGVSQYAILYYGNDGKWHQLPASTGSSGFLKTPGGLGGGAPSWVNPLPSDLAFTDVSNVFTVGGQTIQTGDDANKGVVVTAHSGTQSANYFEAQSSAGAPRAFISPGVVLTSLDNNYFGLKPGTREYRFGTYDANGAMVFSRSDSNTAFQVILGTNTMTFGSIGGSNPTMYMLATGGLLLSGGEGGGQGTIQLGRRKSDSAASVGVSAEFWPFTGQTTPVICTVKPGGGTGGVSPVQYRFEVDVEGDIYKAYESSTTNARLQMSIISTWATSTDASRKARTVFSAYDTAIRECFRMEASGSAGMVSFFGGGAVVQQTGDVAAALVAYNLLASPTYGTHGRATAQTAAAASVATVTVGAADGSFMVSANVLITASVTHSFSATCTYTDEGGTSRVLTLNFSQLTGAFVTALTNILGASAYEGVPVHIRAKAGTTITIDTTGTFTSVTYNVEGHITQVA